MTREKLADTIEILDLCKPIRDHQGGMWFNRNHNFADATFVDYGACRAFAIAARAFPELVAALEKVRSYNVDIAAGRINYRPHDHIKVIDDAFAKVQS